MVTTMDVFSLVAVPGSQVIIHNVMLVDVRQGEDGHDVLIIEHQGVKRELPGSGRFSAQFSMGRVGRVGCLYPMAMPVPGQGMDLRARLDVRGCVFREYVEPSLRRVVELDQVEGDGKALAGWVCDAHPEGFLAPAGLTPGTNGQFVRDETIEVTLRIPPEFVRECRRVQLSPQELLRGFVGDAAGIQNYVNNPRADGYGSNGSDEREMAEAWIERAYGIYAIDIYAAEAEDEEAQERQFERDDLGELLNDYVSYGGKASDVMKVMRELVNKQAALEAGQGQG